jgi:ribonuclease T2
MHWAMKLLLGIILLHGSMARADGERAGDFDYFVLALSWSPNWCKLEGRARDSEQCDKRMGWVVHGLWPQYEDGWPAYCLSGERAPSRQVTAAQADLFGTGGSAWYQWKKHGVCSGLSATDYYALAREAYESVEQPEVLEKIDRTFSIPASLIEEAFLKANPAWEPDMLTVTCTDGHIQEARLCLTKDLEPRGCAADTVRDCTLSKALIEPIR